jgi:hypothetical protein
MSIPKRYWPLLIGTAAAHVALMAGFIADAPALAQMTDRSPALSPAFTASAVDLGAVESPVLPREAVSRAEFDARYGWLALTEIGDARRALRDGHMGEARSIVAGAKIRLTELRDSEPQSDANSARPPFGRARDALIAQAIGPSSTSAIARISEAKKALRAGDAAHATALLAAAEPPLREALLALDEQLHPQTVTRGAVEPP